MTVADWVAVLSRIYLVMVFCAAVIGKLRSRTSALHALSTMLAVPDGLDSAVLVGIIMTETAIAFTLVASPLAGAWLALIFTVLATVALIGVLLRGRPARCLCFGGEGESVSWLDVARNAIVCGACCGAIVWNGPFRVAGMELAILVSLGAIGLIVTIGLPRIAAVLR